MEYLKLVLDTKRVEDCTDRTIDYYGKTICHLLRNVDASVLKMTTDEIKPYLVVHY